MAYLLAERGLEVVLIEKARLPHYKTCGGGVTLKAVKNLPFDANPSFDEMAVGGILSYAGRQLIKTDSQPTGGWLVMRDHFDHYLVQQAVQAGAHLYDGLAVTGVDNQGGEVTVRTPQGSFSARTVAGADGINSLVARSAGLLSWRDAGVAIEAELAVPPAALAAQGAYATFDFGVLQGGYGWIFPKRDHLSVGVFQAHPGKALGIRKSLDRFIASQAVLKENRPMRLHGHHIPLGGRTTLLHQGRVLLVGDAANLADPWLGESISYAIASARMAADALGLALEVGPMELGRYTARVNAEIVRQFNHAHHFAGLVYRLPGFSSIILSRSRLIQEAVFSVLRGDLTFKQLERRLVWQFQRLLVQVLTSSGSDI